MKALLKSVVAFMTSETVCQLSLGRIVARSFPVAIVGGATCHYRGSSGAPAQVQAAVPLEAWWREATEHPILTVLMVVGAVVAFAHGQKLIAVALTLLAGAVREAAEANNDVAVALDELFKAIRALLTIRRPPSTPLSG